MHVSMCMKILLHHTVTCPTLALFSCMMQTLGCQMGQYQDPPRAQDVILSQDRLQIMALMRVDVLCRPWMRIVRLHFKPAQPMSRQGKFSLRRAFRFSQSKTFAKFSENSIPTLTCVHNTALSGEA